MDNVKSGVNTRYKAFTDLAKNRKPEGVNQTEIRLIGSNGDHVVFRATPEVEESGSTIYQKEDAIRVASSFLIWLGSPSRNFNISAKLISRTVAEAEENYKFVSLLRAWRMPSNGAGTGTLGNDKAAPETLRLWGYDGDNKGHFLGIPVVVESLGLTFPEDTDYITTSAGYQMPIVMPVSLTLVETHTASDIEKFNYGAYKQGVLVEWT